MSEHISDSSSLLTIDPSTIESVRTHIHNDRDRIYSELSEIVAFNSLHSDPACRKDLYAAADWVSTMLRTHGLHTTVYEGIDDSRIVIGTEPVPRPELPTIILYCHSDVVAVPDPTLWSSDPFTLTERDGRWYGRGAADCKGNLVMHLAVLRALNALGARGDARTVNLTVVVEGSEEQSGLGLDDLIERHPELFAADAILIADSGNAAAGVPTLTTSLRGGAQILVTVSTLESALHSGEFGGAAPDAVAALIRLLDTLRDDTGRTVIDGINCLDTWDGRPYDPDAFRADAGMLDGTAIMGTLKDNPADMLWARPAVTVIGFDSTPVAQAVNAIGATATAKLNLRVPAHMDPATVADALVAHLRAHVPWGAHIDISVQGVNPAFQADTTLRGARLMSEALSCAYDGKETVCIGSGGSIPLTARLNEAHPNAEITLFGVEEPLARIHSVNESVDPKEIEAIGIAETLFILAFAS